LTESVQPRPMTRGIMRVRTDFMLCFSTRIEGLGSGPVESGTKTDFGAESTTTGGGTGLETDDSAFGSLGGGGTDSDSEEAGGTLPAHPMAITANGTKPAQEILGRRIGSK